MYSCYGITFDSTCLWTFDNDTARNVIILGVDNSSSFHAEKLENKFLALGEGATFGINGGFGPLEKKVIAFIAFHDLHFFSTFLSTLQPRFSIIGWSNSVYATIANPIGKISVGYSHFPLAIHMI